jgi:predicted DNA-binding transcriptional regulator YafY
MKQKKASSLLTLAKYLTCSREGFSVDEMAAHAKVSRPTAERMKAIIEDIFGPLEVIKIGKIKRYRMSEPSLGLFSTAPTKDQLSALKHAIKTFKNSGETKKLHSLKNLAATIELNDQSNQSYKEIIENQTLLSLSNFERHLGPRHYLDPDSLFKIRSALLQQKMISFNYENDPTNNACQKIIPYGILIAQRYFLVGCKEKLQSPFLFCFDNITDVLILDRPGIPPRSFKLDDFIQSSFNANEDMAEEIILKFNPRIAYDAKTFHFSPSQLISYDTDGALIVNFYSADFRKIANFLLAWGEDALIIQSDRLKVMMSELVKKLKDHYL